MSLLFFLHFVTILTCCLAGSIKFSNYENGPSYRNQKPRRSSYGGPSFGPIYGYTSIGSRTLQLSCVPDQMSVGFYLCEAINPAAAQLQSYPTYGYAQKVYGQSLGNYGMIPKQFNYQPRYPNPYGMSSNYIQSEILPPGGGNPITINCNSPTGGADSQTGGASNPTGGANNQPSCNCDQTPGMNSPQQPASDSNSGANGGNQVFKTKEKAINAAKSKVQSTLQKDDDDEEDEEDEDEDEEDEDEEDEEMEDDKDMGKEATVKTLKSGLARRRRIKVRGKN